MKGIIKDWNTPSLVTSQSSWSSSAKLFPDSDTRRVRSTSLHRCMATGAIPLALKWWNRETSAVMELEYLECTSNPVVVALVRLLLYYAVKAMKFSWHWLMDWVGIYRLILKRKKMRGKFGIFDSNDAIVMPQHHFTISATFSRLKSLSPRSRWPRWRPLHDLGPRRWSLLLFVFKKTSKNWNILKLFWRLVHLMVNLWFRLWCCTEPVFHATSDR